MLVVSIKTAATAAAGGQLLGGCAVLGVGEVIHRGSASWKEMKDFSGLLEGVGAAAPTHGGRVCSADTLEKGSLQFWPVFYWGFWNNLSYF